MCMRCVLLFSVHLKENFTKAPLPWPSMASPIKAFWWMNAASMDAPPLLMSTSIMVPRQILVASTSIPILKSSFIMSVYLSYFEMFHSDTFPIVPQAILDFNEISTYVWTNCFKYIWHMNWNACTSFIKLVYFDPSSINMLLFLKLFLFSDYMSLWSENLCVFVPFWWPHSSTGFSLCLVTPTLWGLLTAHLVPAQTHY